MKGRICIKPTEEIRSCNVCSARNYDSETAVIPGDKVDVLYEVHIGNETGGFSFCFCMCRDCLKALGEVCNAVDEEKEG